jgi:hypothetical protein
MCTEAQGRVVRAYGEWKTIPWCLCFSLKSSGKSLLGFKQRSEIIRFLFRKSVKMNNEEKPGNRGSGNIVMVGASKL